MVMSDDSQVDRKRTRVPRNPDFIGAEAALKRAAIKAQRRAIETSGSYAVYRDGKIVHVTEVPGLYKDELEKD